MIADLAKHVVTTLALAGLEGSVLAAIAAVVCRGNVRPAWRAAIWLVVVARFALPWTPELPWSLADLVATARDDAAPLSAAAAGAAVTATHASAAWLFALVAWIVPAAVVFGRGVARIRAVHRRAVASRSAPAHALAELAAVAARLASRVPALGIGDAATGPHVVGVRRPIVVVPPVLLDDPALLRAALLHELAHVRRRDAIGRAVQLVATSLFWFWPVARLVARRLDLAREAACDAWALEAGELPRPAYARLLVAMARLQLGARDAALAMAGHHLDARVAAVLAAPAHARLGRGQRVVIVAFALIALGGARTAHARGAPPPCAYTPEIAAALYSAHPEADLDGDGVLSRDEACELQAELRKLAASAMSAEEAVSLAEPLYCNRDLEVGQLPAESTCHQGDGQ